MDLDCHKLFERFIDDRVDMNIGKHNRHAFVLFCYLASIAAICASCSNGAGPDERPQAESGLRMVRDTLFIDEGESPTISALFNGSSTDGLTISWNSGDGRSRTEPLLGDSCSISYTYENNGTYLVVILAERNGVIVGADTAVVVDRQRFVPVPAGKVVIRISEAVLTYSDTIKIANRPVVYRLRDEQDVSLIAFAGDALRESARTFVWNGRLETRISNRSSDAQGGHLRTGAIRLSPDGTAIEELSLYSKDSLGWVIYKKKPGTLREARIQLADIPIQAGSSPESENAVYTGYFSDSAAGILQLEEYYYSHGTIPMASILTGVSTGYRVTVAFSK